MKPEEFFEYRSKIAVQNLNVSLGSLKAVIKDDNLFLEVEGQKSDLFRIEEIFIKKLFRWFYTGTEMVNLLSTEAKLHVVNNLLSEISYRGKNYPDNYVKLRVEDGSVYSILASIYETVEDTEFYKAIKDFGITYVEHSPYITRFISDIRLQTEAIVGDRMGYALHFTNSQTGFGALTSSVFVFRYTCRNGAVAIRERDSIFFHGRDAFKKFCDSVCGIESFFDEIVPEFDRGLIKARTIKYKKEMHPLVQNIIGPALTVFETRKMMKALERCTNLWEIYDHLTTSAKEMGIYEKFLLQEAAGNIICQLVRNPQEADKSGPEN
ncbi:MAG: hypothetical protein L6Q59_10340 [Ignavibacteriaceae bacterium]|nr:hypothetical protein [Ignavibacteriaceae bacterium]